MYSCIIFNQTAVISPFSIPAPVQKVSQRSGAETQQAHNDKKPLPAESGARHQTTDRHCTSHPEYVLIVIIIIITIKAYP